MSVKSKIKEFIVTKSNYIDKKSNKKINCVDLFDLNGNLLVHYEDINPNHWINSDINLI